MSEATVASLFDGAYGAFVNLDGFAMGEWGGGQQPRGSDGGQLAWV